MFYPLHGQTFGVIYFEAMRGLSDGFSEAFLRLTRMYQMGRLDDWFICM